MSGPSTATQSPFSPIVQAYLRVPDKDKAKKRNIWKDQDRVYTVRWLDDVESVVTAAMDAINEDNAALDPDSPNSRFIKQAKWVKTVSFGAGVFLPMWTRLEAIIEYLLERSQWKDPWGWVWLSDNYSNHYHLTIIRTLGFVECPLHSYFAADEWLYTSMNKARVLRNEFKAAAAEPEQLLRVREYRDQLRDLSLDTLLPALAGKLRQIMQELDTGLQ